LDMPHPKSKQALSVGSLPSMAGGATAALARATAEGYGDQDLDPPSGTSILILISTNQHFP